MIWITGDLHGGETICHISSHQFRGDKGDIVLCAGDLGGVWYHDYHTNEKHRRQEDYFLESHLQQRFLWLAVDGNHENFARLFGGEFPLVEIFSGQAYKVREHVYYLKRGSIFTIEGKTFLAFGGANSHDRFGSKARTLAWGGGCDYVPPRKEGIDWWPEEIPSADDFENACSNLDKVGWKVDHVVSHTCPVSLRLLFGGQGRPADPTETILQDLWDKGLQFNSWHFGHFHVERQIDKFICHYDRVRPLTHTCEVIHEAP